MNEKRPTILPLEAIADFNTSNQPQAVLETAMDFLTVLISKCTEQLAKTGSAIITYEVAIKVQGEDIKPIS